MKTVAVVPMKLNNERLPNKNTKRFDNGQPLCWYILDTLKKVPGIDAIYVYCSNPAIQDFIPDGIRYLKRSENLDTSQTKMNEVLRCFAADVDADIYLMTHATSPFVRADSIAKALAQVQSGRHDSALAVRKIQEFLWQDNQPLNYDLANIPRTQDLPVIYSETSGFYIYEKAIIACHNRRIGFNPYLQEVSGIEALDIDEQDDFDIANAVYTGIIARSNQGETP
jgi:CMP-N-acetylneuraminic acid synthetase